jgi:hypothetical protein
MRRVAHCQSYHEGRDERFGQNAQNAQAYQHPEARVRVGGCWRERRKKYLWLRELNEQHILESEAGVRGLPCRPSPKYDLRISEIEFYPWWQVFSRSQ